MSGVVLGSDPGSENVDISLVLNVFLQVRCFLYFSVDFWIGFVFLRYEEQCSFQ